MPDKVLKVYLIRYRVKVPRYYLLLSLAKTQIMQEIASLV